MYYLYEYLTYYSIEPVIYLQSNSIGHSMTAWQIHAILTLLNIIYTESRLSFNQKKKKIKKTMVSPNIQKNRNNQIKKLPQIKCLFIYISPTHCIVKVIQKSIKHIFNAFDHISLRIFNGSSYITLWIGPFVRWGYI